MRKFRYTNLFLVLACLFDTTVVAQPGQSTKWSRDGQYIYEPSTSSIVAVKLSDGSQSEKVPARLLTQGNYQIRIRDFDFSADEKKLLVYANAQRVWRYDTRGDYYVLDLGNNSLKKLGADLPQSSHVR